MWLNIPDPKWPSNPSLMVKFSSGGKWEKNRESKRLEKRKSVRSDKCNVKKENGRRKWATSFKLREDFYFDFFNLAKKALEKISHSENRLWTSII